MLGSTFKDFVIHTTTETTAKNLGSVITSYVKFSAIQCDIQPIEEATRAKTWGEDIEATLQIWCDEALNVGDIIVYNNEAYAIEKVIDWISYRNYAIKKVDVEIG